MVHPNVPLHELVCKRYSIEEQQESWVFINKLLEVTNQSACE